MRTTILGVAIYLASLHALAQPIKPETLVRFPDSSIACLTKDALGKVSTHFLMGEQTKGNAMFVGPGNPKGECVMLSRTKTFKVLAAEYNNPESPGMGIIEVVDAKSRASDGAWTFTMAAKPTK